LNQRYDAIVIGGGHNGLVTACYLARAKWKVLVLERRYIVGGACVSEEIWPGYKVSTAAYVNSLFRPEIIETLRLRDYGFEPIERNPASFSPFEDGRYLLLGTGSHRDVEEIAKFSARDAERYPQYEAMLERVASVVEPTLTQVPPNLLRPSIPQLFDMGKMGRALQKLGPGMGEAIEVLTGAARPILDRWFESDQLKATIATDAIIGAFMAPSMPGTAYVLFHHVMGETNGKRGVWSYVKGGMGGLTQALARAATDLGVDIRTEAEVAKILTKEGRVTGVALRDGDEFSAKTVASGVDCHITFQQLLDPAELLPAFNDAIGRISYSSASCKINVALDRLPIRILSNARTTMRSSEECRPSRSSSARFRRRWIRPSRRRASTSCRCSRSTPHTNLPTVRGPMRSETNMRIVALPSSKSMHPALPAPSSRDKS